MFPGKHVGKNGDDSSSLCCRVHLMPVSGELSVDCVFSGDTLKEPVAVPGRVWAMGSQLEEKGSDLRMASQRITKRSFKMDLAEMHALCEANYARLLRLFPDYETSNRKEFFVAQAQVCVDVIERCRYTTIFVLQQQHAGDTWLGKLKIQVRAYHDAAMLEVGMFQSHRSVNARYRYPNEKMYQQDEKSQQNRFLADWLEHCLQNGHAKLGTEMERGRL